MRNVPVVELHDFCIHHRISRSMMLAHISAGEVDAWVASGGIWITRGDAVLVRMKAETLEAEEAEKVAKRRRRK